MVINTHVNRVNRSITKYIIKKWYYTNIEKKRKSVRDYYAIRRYNFNGILNPESKVGMGVITEHVVYEVLKDCEKCNISGAFNSNSDLISDKYGNINVKSSKLYEKGKYTSWQFNKHIVEFIPNYYICLGFNENKTSITKVWIIPGNENIIAKTGIYISKCDKGLMRFLKYEVDPTPYNEVYQNLNIYSLLEFCNLTSNTTYTNDIKQSDSVY